MKIRNIFLISAFVLLIAIAGCSSKSDNTGQVNVNPSVVNVNGNSNNPQNYNLDISNFAFSTTELKIKKGDTITWTNRDSMIHTVTSDTGSELASVSLSNEKGYSHTFNNAGTYSYHCNFHSGMKGNVVVE